MDGSFARRLFTLYSKRITAVLNIFPKKSIVTAPKVEKNKNKIEVHMKNLQDTGGLKLVMIFYLYLPSQASDFEIYSLEFPRNICLGVISGYVLYL